MEEHGASPAIALEHESCGTLCEPGEARGASARKTSAGSRAGWSGGISRWQERQVTASTQIVAAHEGHVRTSPTTTCARAPACARPSLDGSSPMTSAHGPPSRWSRHQPMLRRPWCQARRAATMPQSHQMKTNRMRHVLLLSSPCFSPPQTTWREETALVPVVGASGPSRVPRTPHASPGGHRPSPRWGRRYPPAHVSVRACQWTCLQTQWRTSSAVGHAATRGTSPVGSMLSWITRRVMDGPILPPAHQCTVYGAERRAVHGAGWLSLAPRPPTACWERPHPEASRPVSPGASRSPGAGVEISRRKRTLMIGDAAVLVHPQCAQFVCGWI